MALPMVRVFIISSPLSRNLAGHTYRACQVLGEWFHQPFSSKPAEGPGDSIIRMKVNPGILNSLPLRTRSYVGRLTIFQPWCAERWLYSPYPPNSQHASMAQAGENPRSILQVAHQGLAS